MKQKGNKFPISSELMSITEQQVSHLDQEVAEGKGWDFYCNGQVVQSTVFQDRLSGIVVDDFNQYNVEIKIDKDQIIGTCNCSVRGQICKHIVALLYSWVNDGEGFEDVGNALQLLENKNKEELLAIISRMIVKNPRNIVYCSEEDTILDDGFEMEEMNNWQGTSMGRF